LFVPDDGSSALPVLVGGEPENVDEARASEILSEGKFEIKIQLGIGEENAKYWTCDFSYVSLSLLSEIFFEGLFGKSAAKIERRRVIPLLLCFTLSSSFPIFNHCTLCLLLRGTESFRVFLRLLSLLGIREDQRRVSHLNTDTSIAHFSLLSDFTAIGSAIRLKRFLMMDGLLISMVSYRPAVLNQGFSPPTTEFCTSFEFVAVLSGNPSVCGCPRSFLL